MDVALSAVISSSHGLRIAFGKKCNRALVTYCRKGMYCEFVHYCTMGPYYELGCYCRMGPYCDWHAYSRMGPHYDLGPYSRMGCRPMPKSDEGVLRLFSV